MGQYWVVGRVTYYHFNRMLTRDALTLGRTGPARLPGQGAPFDSRLSESAVVAAPPRSWDGAVLAGEPWSLPKAGATSGGLLWREGTGQGTRRHTWQTKPREESHTLERSRLAGFGSSGPSSEGDAVSQERFEEAVTVTVMKGLPGMTHHILSKHTLPTTVIHVHQAAIATSPLSLAQRWRDLHRVFLAGWGGC